MRILVDLCHPGHVHFFRNAVREWRERGDEVTLAARDKDLTLDLLSRAGWEHTVLSRAGRGVLGLGAELVWHQLRLLALARRTRPHLVLNVGGVAVVHAAKLLGIPSLVFTDTEHAALSNRLTFPFATRVFTPECFGHDLGPRQVRYAGYHELAYLHPSRFTPDPDRLRAAGVSPEERFFLLRVISWRAAHDIGRRGLGADAVREIVRRLSRSGRVFVTAEGALPRDLEPHRLPVAAEHVHDLLSFCSLYVGEGATMASEAAILGCPAIYTNPLRLGYLDELESRYGLVHNAPTAEQALQAVEALAARDDLRREAERKRRRMLEDKIDVTAWLIEAVDDWRPLA